MVVPGHSLQAAAVEGVTRIRSVGAASDSRHEQISTASGFLYGLNVRRGFMPIHALLLILLAANMCACTGGLFHESGRIAAPANGVASALLLDRLGKR